MAAQEPHLVVYAVMVILIPFSAYFLGVYIRKATFPSPGSPSLKKQFLMAIPISLTVVAASMGLLENARADMGVYLMVLGTIMQQGLLVNERFTKAITAEKGA